MRYWGRPMFRLIALLLAFSIATQVYSQDKQDSLQLFRQAINEKERENYVLSFEVTYPRSKQNDVYEKLKFEYLIKVRGEERYSIRTWYFIDKKPHDRKMTSQYFNLSAFSIRYDTAPFHLEFYTIPRSIEHSHNIDYRKLGRLTHPLGPSNGIPLSEYDRFFSAPFVKKQRGANEIEYHRQTGKTESTLIFKDGNTAYPAVSKVVYHDEKIKIEQMHEVKCGNDKSFPTEIDYYDYRNGELIEHQRIRNIKSAPLPADFVFTPTLLNIPINAKALRDGMQEMYWDGRKFVDRPVNDR